MKVAIVHDDLLQFGGAERLLLAISEIWPSAPIFTSMYNPQLVAKYFPGVEIVSSWMQKLPFKTSWRRFYLPFYPLAFESFDFSNYNLVISSSTRFAHGVITKPKTLHICYLNSPPRYLWEEASYLASERLWWPLKLMVKLMGVYLRLWDVTAAARVDVFCANSQNVAAKIAKIYRRESTVIYPFVDWEKFALLANTKPTTGEFFLVVTRLLAWKRVDIAIKAFNQLKLPLKIVGTGPQFLELKKMAQSNVELLGYVNDAELVSLYQNCRALIMTQEEDFGIACLEAQAAGKPVIAYEAGGVKETILPGETGVFFPAQTKEALIAAVKQFEKMEFDPEKCLANAKRFSKTAFVNNFKLLVEKSWQARLV